MSAAPSSPISAALVKLGPLRQHDTGRLCDHAVDLGRDDTGQRFLSRKVIFVQEDQYLTALLTVLGPGDSRYADPRSWERLERELGFGLPEDYKCVVDRYAPVIINGHLSLCHPATVRWNLGDWMRRTVAAWSRVPWGEGDIEGDPRPLLGIPEMRFGTQDGLLPCASTDRGETLFFAPGGAGTRWRIFVEDGEGEFFEYFMSFAKWLYLYVSGEDVAGPGSSVFYPGPVELCGLPMTPDDKPEAWYGPPR